MKIGSWWLSLGGAYSVMEAGEKPLSEDLWPLLD
jgi:hypothetical protein